MGGGVALAALGSAFAYIAKSLSDVKSILIILAVIAVAILAVIVPTSIVAMVKLRRRDLSAILAGSGWAIPALPPRASTGTDGSAGRASGRTISGYSAAAGTTSGTSAAATWATTVFTR